MMNDNSTMMNSDSTMMGNDSTMMGNDAKMMKNTTMYACPMHPEVQGKLNDKCAKCGMKLTEPVPETAVKAITKIRIYLIIYNQPCLVYRGKVD
jgi:hypothetical protein